MQALDSARRDALRAVVVDANVFSEGRPDLKRLDSLATRLADIDIEMFVPEPVAWEWAEHLAADIENHRVTTRATQKKLERALLNPGNLSLPYPSKQATVGAFLAALNSLEYVGILPLTGESARQALRDQILLTGPGSQKNGVKTGASDSAWLRDALAYVKGDPNALIILTNNRKDVEALCRSLDIVVPLMYSIATLPESLFTFVAASDAISALVMQYILDRLPLNYIDHPHGDVAMAEINFGTIESAPSSFESRGQETHVQEVELQRITQLIGVNYVTIEEGNEETTHRTASAVAWMLADLDVAAYLLDRDGAVEMDSWQFSGSLIVAPILIEFDRDNIVSIAGAGETVAHLNDDYADAFADSIDGLSEVRRVFELIQGFRFPEDWPDVEDLDISTEVNSNGAELTFSGDPRNEWAIVIEVGAARVEVRCVYDTTADARDDGESFSMRPPYSLSSIVDGEQLPGVYPAVARVVRELYTKPVTMD